MEGQAITGFTLLTPQPSLPKLRLSTHMPINRHRLIFVALLLGVIFLVAQFHFCADLTLGPASAHFCPFCSTAGSAVTPQSPGIAVVPVTNSLVILAVFSIVFTLLPRPISPRAPPSL